MAANLHYTRPTRSQLGTSEDDTRNEPDWVKTHNHRIGFRDRNDRHPGYTHIGDDWDTEQEREFLAQAKKEADELNKKLGEHDLTTVRDYMAKQEDYHLRLPQNHPPGWRYVLHTTEDFLKYKQDWLVNVKRRQLEEDEKKKNKKQKENNKQEPQNEHDWRRGRGENETHNEAPATGQQRLDDDSKGGKMDQEESLQGKYSPQELSLLRLPQSESNYIKILKENDGKVEAPRYLTKEQDTSINQDDQFTPDNWIPRSFHLIHLTGKDPLDGEPELQALYEADLVTPNLLHYVY